MMNNYGNRAFSEAENRGWSQAEFARRCGYNSGTFTKVKNGDISLHVDLVIAISRALDENPINALIETGHLTQAEADDNAAHRTARSLTLAELTLQAHLKALDLQQPAPSTTT